MSDGSQAEQWAQSWLQQQGLTIVDCNVRCRFGEIDIIARDGKTLVFVEVRLRRANEYGGALASVDERKQQKLIRSAQLYLSRLATVPPCRFDVVVMADVSGRDVCWVKNAFEAY